MCSPHITRKLSRKPLVSKFEIELKDSVYRLAIKCHKVYSIILLVLYGNVLVPMQVYRDHLEVHTMNIATGTFRSTCDSLRKILSEKPLDLIGRRQVAWKPSSGLPDGFADSP